MPIYKRWSALIQDVFRNVLDHVCPQLISLIVVYVNDDNADFVSLRQILLHGFGVWSRIKNEDSTVGPILSLIILYIMTTQSHSEAEFKWTKHSASEIT